MKKRRVKLVVMGVVVLFLAVFYWQFSGTILHPNCQEIKESSIKGAKSHCSGDFLDERHLVRFKGSREHFEKIVSGMEPMKSVAYDFDRTPRWWKNKDKSGCISYRIEKGNIVREVTYDSATDYIYIAEWDR